MPTESNHKATEKKSLKTLTPIFAFVLPYKKMLAGALTALLLTSAVSLSLGQGVRMIIDNGFIAGSEEQLTSAVGVMIIMITLLAFGTFTRFYLMSWLGERVSADIRKAVNSVQFLLQRLYF